MAAKLKSRQGLKDYLLLLSTIGPLDSSREFQLLELSRHGDEEAVRQLVEAYLPQVLAWVSPRRGQALSFQELIAIGNCALIEAVKAYRGRPEKFKSAAQQGVDRAVEMALKMST